MNNNRANLVANKNPIPIGIQRSSSTSSNQQQNKIIPQVPTVPPAQPTFLGDKCGELFVTKNAKMWTFVCTYCQKTTRDIGEFVCHIKNHLDKQAAKQAVKQQQQQAAAINYNSSEDEVAEEQDVS